MTYKTRKPLAVLASLALLAGLGVSAPAFAATNPIPENKRQFQGVDSLTLVPKSVLANKQVLTFAAYGGGNVTTQTSFVANETDSKMCTSVDNTCAGAGDRLWVHGFATVCELETSSLCIAKVEMRQDEGEWQTAEFSDYWDSTPNQGQIDRLMTSGDPFAGRTLSVSTMKSWPENTAWQLPAGAPGPATFKAPGVLNAAGADTYLVSADYEYNANGFVNGKPANQRLHNFKVNIRPFVGLDDKTARSNVEFFSKNSKGTVRQGGSGPALEFGSWEVNGRVGYSAAYAAGTEIRLTMHLPQSLGGWFHSRVSNPTIDLKSISPTVNEFVMSGGSTEIDTTAGWVDRFSSQGLKFKAAFGGQQSYDYAKEQLARGKGGMSSTSWNPGDPLSFFTQFAPLLGDKAKGSGSVWYVYTMPANALGNNKCLKDRSTIQGLVNTNAMAYQPSIPIYKNGFLQYEVAGLHYKDNGKLARGNYDLMMRSEVARCLYGFSSAPVSASVSVINEGGAKSFATTVVGESNGWLKLSAKNFTFSKKTIKIKLKGTKK